MIYELLSTQLNQTEVESYKFALDAIDNPVHACQQLHEKIEILTQQISELEATREEGKLLNVLSM